MNKLSVLALALVMMFSVNVFAETGTIGRTVNVNGTVFNSGDAYTAREVHTYSQAFTLNGQQVAAGTQLDAVLVNGTWVPVGSTVGGLAAVGAGVAGMSTGVIVGTIAVVGAAVALASGSNNVTFTTVTQ